MPHFVQWSNPLGQGSQEPRMNSGKPNSAYLLTFGVHSLLVLFLLMISFTMTNNASFQGILLLTTQSETF